MAKLFNSRSRRWHNLLLFRVLIFAICTVLSTGEVIKSDDIRGTNLRGDGEHFRERELHSKSAKSKSWGWGWGSKSKATKSSKSKGSKSKSSSKGSKSTSSKSKASSKSVSKKGKSAKSLDRDDGEGYSQTKSPNNGEPMVFDAESENMPLQPAEDEQSVAENSSSADILQSAEYDSISIVNEGDPDAQNVSSEVSSHDNVPFSEAEEIDGTGNTISEATETSSDDDEHDDEDVISPETESVLETNLEEDNVVEEKIEDNSYIEGDPDTQVYDGNSSPSYDLSQQEIEDTANAASKDESIIVERPAPEAEFIEERIEEDEDPEQIIAEEGEALDPSWESAE